MKLKNHIDKDWYYLLNFDFKYIEKFLTKEYDKYIIYPSKSLIFNVYNLCSLDNIKVVIIGQDPYQTQKYNANGLAFSSGERIAPSLHNVFKELKIKPKHGDLTNWVKEGVFLLNTVLTVRDSESHSHKDKGWEEFTDSTIELISEQRKNIVFLLWGSYAHKKEYLINTSKHCIIKTSHPRSISAFKTNSPFMGSKCFTKANKYLEKNKIKQINWELL